MPRPRALAITCLWWAALAVSATGVAWGLKALHVPAALMLGPMLAAIVCALGGAGLELPRQTLLGAQAVFGCLIAAAVNDALLGELKVHGWLFVVFALLSVAMTAGLGAWITRRGWMPGTTAIWGLAPGAASTMVAMSDSHGADARTVAVMQYLRVAAVALSIVVVASWLGDPSAAPARRAAAPAATPTWAFYAPTAALALAGLLAALLLRNAAAGLLLPTFAGGALQASGVASLHVPDAAAALAFGLVGCSIGLRFTRASLLQCWRLMPAMVLAIVAMVLGCGLLAWPLLWVSPRTDALSALLALAPGGMDTAVAAAGSVTLALPLILAAQLVRFIVVTLTAPAVARQVSKWQRTPQPGA